MIEFLDFTVKNAELPVVRACSGCKLHVFVAQSIRIYI